MVRRDDETPDDQDNDAVEIPITDTLDLHPFRAAEVRDVARAYLEEARSLGLRQVRLIHGRGVGCSGKTSASFWRRLILWKPFTTRTGAAAGGERRWCC